MAANVSRISTSRLFESTARGPLSCTTKRHYCGICEDDSLSQTKRRSIMAAEGVRRTTIIHCRFRYHHVIYVSYNLQITIKDSNYCSSCSWSCTILPWCRDCSYGMTYLHALLWPDISAIDTVSPSTSRHILSLKNTKCGGEGL
jgi:hypothetical protein